METLEEFDEWYTEKEKDFDSKIEGFLFVFNAIKNLISVLDSQFGVETAEWKVTKTEDAEYLNKDEYADLAYRKSPLGNEDN